MGAAIIGWGHSHFGKLQDGLEEMIVAVADEAIASAGLQASDIDAIVLGHFGDGFQKQAFTASLVLQAHEDLRFKPAVRVENACATGSAAVHTAISKIRANEARYVLVVGAEKMTEITTDAVGDVLLKAAYLREEGDVRGGFAGIFGQIAERYFQRYGDKSEALAHIAAKNHGNAVDNPYAHMQKPLSVEFCREVSDKNPYVAGVLKRSDCSLISDGAAAMVITSAERALHHERAIAFRGASHVSDFLPMSRRDIVRFEGAREAWRRAYDEAGITVKDLDLVETHDCFTIAELIEYEAMGLAEEGCGAEVILEGRVARGGELPVNVSGGLKSKGHPIGATGVSMHVLCSMQLLGDAGAMQVDNVGLAGLYNMGGAAVANYVSILERIK